MRALTTQAGRLTLHTGNFWAPWFSLSISTHAVAAAALALSLAHGNDRPPAQDQEEDSEDSQKLRFYHATSRQRAMGVANGIDLTRVEPRSDFGLGFYTTVHFSQAQQWARQNYADPVVMEFKVDRWAFEMLDVLNFWLSETNVVDGTNWQTFVWQGRNGIWDTEWHGYDLVNGLFLQNVGAITPQFASSFNAHGRSGSNQQAWVTEFATIVLENNGSRTIDV